MEPNTARPQGAPALGDFERLLFDLIEAGALLEGHGDAATLLRLAPGTMAVLVPYRPGRDAELQAKLAELMVGLGKGQLLEVMLVGGPIEARALLERARPAERRKAVLLYHQAQGGERWGAEGLGSKPLGKHLASKPLCGPASAAELEAFAKRFAEMEKRAAADAEEMSLFAGRLQGRRPIGTWALAAAITAVFGLQVLFDGADSTPVLARMGALIPERVLQGEWWRLLSSSFLHGGFVHFALNTYVLLVLGSSIERVLGRARFFAIYGLSALVASLVAMVASDAGLTVGASGAIWGLLAAESVLVLRPRGLLPEVVQQRSRRSVVTNLVINAGVSFLPNVAMAAHFGGAAAGALLMLPAFFLKGVPTIEQLRRGGPEARLTAPVWLRTLALVNLALLAVSLVAGIGAGRAWMLRGEPELSRRAAGSTGLSAELPVLLAPEPGSPVDGARVAYFGNIALDPAAIVVSAVDFPAPIPEEQMEAELEGLREALRRAPEGTVLDVEPRAQQIGEKPVVTVRYRAQNGLELEVAHVTMPERLWKVELLYRPQYQSQYAGLAAKMAASIQATGTPQQPAAEPSRGDAAAP